MRLRLTFFLALRACGEEGVPWREEGNVCHLYYHRHEHSRLWSNRHEQSLVVIWACHRMMGEGSYLYPEVQDSPDRRRR